MSSTGAFPKGMNRGRVVAVPYQALTKIVRVLASGQKDHKDYKDLKDGGNRLCARQMIMAFRVAQRAMRRSYVFGAALECWSHAPALLSEAMLPTLGEHGSPS